MDTIESLWIEQQKERYRREHAVDRWRTVAVVAIVCAACGWLCAAILVWGAN